MRLKTEQLASRLPSLNHPVFMITGDEPLIKEESSDLLRAHLQQQGFSEREVLHAEANFKWDELIHSSCELSLFAEKKIIELRLKNPKLNKQASETLQTCINNLTPDTIILVITGKLDATSKKSGWFKTIDNMGVIIEIISIDKNALPSWITKRASALKLQLNAEAIELLVDRIEGNLLAAKQELDKLSLLFPEQKLTADDIIAAVSDSSRYDIYGLSDAALQGQLARCCKIIQVLEQEGIEPSVILWALSRESRSLAAIKFGQKQGKNFDAICQQERIWGQRKSQIRQAAQRLSTTEINQSIQQCSQADKIIKGIETGNIWLVLTSIAAQLSGNPLTLPSLN